MRRLGGLVLACAFALTACVRRSSSSGPSTSCSDEQKIFRGNAERLLGLAARV